MRCAAGKKVWRPLWSRCSKYYGEQGGLVTVRSSFVHGRERVQLPRVSKALHVAHPNQPTNRPTCVRLSRNDAMLQVQQDQTSLREIFNEDRSLLEHAHAEALSDAEQRRCFSLRSQYRSVLHMTSYPLWSCANQLTDHLTKQSISQPTNKATIFPASQSVSQSVN